MSTPTVNPITPSSNDANTLVVDGWNAAQAYASIAFNDATQFLAQLTQDAQKLQAIAPVVGTLGPINATVDQYVSPIAPDTPTDLTMNLPAVPVDPVLTPVALPSFGNAPEFTAVAPVLDIPQEPSPLDASVPVAPNLSPVTVPASPSIVLPGVPTLLGINLPGEPLLNLPTFTAVTPDHPLAPEYLFAFAEPTYTDQLLTDLKATLDEWVNGAFTGLAPEVEDALWDQARSREYAQTNRKIGEAYRQFAARGFSKPPGALDITVQGALQDSQSQLSGLSRDISIKQADLMQTNRRFAMEQAWQVESGLIQYQNQISQRAFEAAKYIQQIALDIYHEQAAIYASDVQAFLAKVEAYKAILQGEITKLDVYRAELDAQKLIGDLNLQSVQIYTAEVQAVQTQVDIFKAQVEAAATQAQVNKTVIDAFAAQVGAYAEQVRAKAAEYSAYATLVQAQVAKVDLFKGQADAYNSQVTGYRSLVDAGTAVANLAVRIGQEVPLEVFKAQNDAFRTVTEAEAARIDVVAKAYSAEVGGYSAAVQAESARIGSQVDVYKAQTEVSVAQGNLSIEAAKTNVATLIQQTSLLIEAVKGGSQVAAQLAAAALASVNLSGQIGEHYTYSDSNSTSSSASQINSVSNSTSTSTSDVTSTSNNTNYNYSN